MPKPSRFKKGKRLSDQQYKYKLQKYYEGHNEKNYTKFKHRINNLVVYGHDYCGIDLNDSVKGNYTHVKF